MLGGIAGIAGVARGRDAASPSTAAAGGRSIGEQIGRFGRFRGFSHGSSHVEGRACARNGGDESTPTQASTMPSRLQNLEQQNLEQIDGCRHWPYIAGHEQVITDYCH
jgi:hypothetical protein